MSSEDLCRAAYEKGLRGERLQGGIFRSPSSEEVESNQRGLGEKNQADEWRKMINKCEALADLDWVVGQLKRSTSHFDLRNLLNMAQEKVLKLLIPEVDRQTSVQALYEIIRWRWNYPSVRTRAIRRILAMAKSFEEANRVFSELATVGEDLTLRNEAMEVLLRLAVDKDQLKSIIHRTSNPSVASRALQRMRELI